MQALRFWLRWLANSSLVCDSSYAQGISQVEHGSILLSRELVVLTRVLNLGDADARGALAGEPQQLITGDFVAQLLGDQGSSIGTDGLSYLLLQGGISGDVSKKLPELVCTHAAGAFGPILTCQVLPLVC